MRKDWFAHGEKLIRPLVVSGLSRGGRPIDYLEGEAARKIATMSREDLETIAVCAVMFGMSGTNEVLQIKKQ